MIFDVMEDRHLYIGASEVSAILGIAPASWNATPLSVWRSKVMPDDEPPRENQAMSAGNRLEPVILDWYADETGLEVRPGERWTGERIRAPMLRAHTDAVAWPGDEIRTDKNARNVEVKNVAASKAGEWGSPGTDQVPPYYRCQVAFQMALANLPVTDLPVLIGGNEFRIYTVERDRAYETAILEACVAWWRRHVEGGVPPEPVTLDDHRRRWVDVAGAVRADQAALDDLLRLAEIQAAGKELTAAADAIKLRIQQRMRDREAIVDTDGRVLVSWKMNGSGRTFRPNYTAIQQTQGNR